MGKGSTLWDFMVEYGWVILVILIAIGTLAYFVTHSPPGKEDDVGSVEPEFVDGLECVKWNGTITVNYYDEHFKSIQEDKYDTTLIRDYLIVTGVENDLDEHLMDEKHFNGTHNTYHTTSIIYETNDTIGVIYSQGFHNDSLAVGSQYVFDRARATFEGTCIKYVRTWEAKEEEKGG